MIKDSLANASIYDGASAMAEASPIGTVFPPRSRSISFGTQSVSVVITGNSVAIASNAAKQKDS